MPNIDVLSVDGKKVKELELNENVFGIEPNENIVHSVIVNYMANQRQGTQNTKTRSEVSGGGRKPWRQKGTGRARQGSIRAVQWVGGGKYGTPVPRDYSIKQNRKERRIALKSALSEKVAEKALIVVEKLNLDSAKTKDMISLLESLKVADKKVLLVVEEFNDNVILASRNIRNLVLISAEEINVLDLVSTDVVVATEEAIKNIEEVLK